MDKYCIVCGVGYEGHFNSRYCGECGIVKKKARAKERSRRYEQKPETRTKRKLERQTPEYKAWAREYNKEYFKIPENKLRRRTWEKQYNQTPQRKEFLKRYKSIPEVKAKMKAYVIKYEKKSKTKKVRLQYRQNHKIKLMIKQYNQQPQIRIRHKQYLKEYRKEYVKRPLAKIKIKARDIQRREREKNVLHNYTWKQWQEKLKLTKGICPNPYNKSYCLGDVGIGKLTLDHIYPLILASKDYERTGIKRVYTIHDVQPLCFSCNCSKSCKLIEDKIVLTHPVLTKHLVK